MGALRVSRLHSRQLFRNMLSYKELYATRQTLTARPVARRARPNHRASTNSGREATVRPPPQIPVYPHCRRPPNEIARSPRRGTPEQAHHEEERSSPAPATFEGRISLARMSRNPHHSGRRAPMHGPSRAIRRAHGRTTSPSISGCCLHARCLRDRAHRRHRRARGVPDAGRRRDRAPPRARRLRDTERRLGRVHPTRARPAGGDSREPSA